MDCRECGASVQSVRTRRDTAFCCDDCRKRFNNRRMTRGAELYDVWMIWRHERGLARARQLFTIMCRIAQDWREQDRRDRAGRPSWHPYTALHDRLLPLRAERLDGHVSAGRIRQENAIAASARPRAAP